MSKLKSLQPRFSFRQFGNVQNRFARTFATTLSTTFTNTLSLHTKTTTKIPMYKSFSEWIFAVSLCYGVFAFSYILGSNIYYGNELASITSNRFHRVDGMIFGLIKSIIISPFSFFYCYYIKTIENRTEIIGNNTVYKNHYMLYLIPNSRKYLDLACGALANNSHSPYLDFFKRHHIVVTNYD
jgi:hypothetical protein